MQPFAHTGKATVRNTANAGSILNGDIVFVGSPLPGECLGAELSPALPMLGALALLCAAELDQGQGELQAMCNVPASLPPTASLGRVTCLVKS